MDSYRVVAGCETGVGKPDKELIREASDYPPPDEEDELDGAPQKHEPEGAESHKDERSQEPGERLLVDGDGGERWQRHSRRLDREEAS